MEPDRRYVVRSTSAERGGFVVYTIVDLAGRVRNVGIDHRYTTDDLAGPILAHAVGGRRAT